MTQHEQIWDYRERFGSITPMEGFADLGITKIATRIGEMRRRGMPIAAKMETGVNRMGKAVRYMRYWIAREETGCGADDAFPDETMERIMGRVKH